MAIDRHHRTYKEKRNAAKRAFARQNAPCWLCSGEIDYKARANTANSFELDHRTAIANGGSLMDVSNWAPSCFRCNRSKGAKDADAFRAEQSSRKPPPVKRTVWW